ncbi:ATP-binding protein [Chitinophaga sp.]|uniref:ATP-binding protein n=1 Tax=Chitinophaga sp. TaxID=1869181 RepID=UPI0031CE9107
MKIKPKLFLGIGTLFTMIALLTTVSIICLNRINNNTWNILTDNYNSLEYAHNMLRALNNNIQDAAQARLFQKNLKLQEQNVTEPGESELTGQLIANYEKIRVNPGDEVALKNIKNVITDIMMVNMRAITRKSSMARQSNKDATYIVSLCGAASFIVAFILLLNLPGNIGDPIKQLTESIKEIAAENYSERLHFKGSSEFSDLARAFNTMAEKLQEYKDGNLEKLLMEKKRIETLINNLQDPVIGLDENRQVLFMNDIALKITGLRLEEVLGKPVQDVAIHNDLIRSLAQDLFQDKEIKAGNTVKIYADQKESYFEKEIIPIKITPTGETEEKLIGNVLLLQNVTPYKELDFAKTNFIATVSHELKTPISSIKMSLQLLENGKLGIVNDGQKELLDSIKDDANRLLKITGELLNVTQVESGSIQISTFATDPIEIINYATNANKIAAEQKNIRLQINIPDNVPKVIADNEKTAWVITNLISNAIRYSYEYSVVTLDVTDSPGKLHFSVSDTGQGIPPEYLGKVFDRYFRIPGTKKEGTGLGLSISKEFIEAEGGTISVKSEFGAGTTFIVTLNKA